MQARRNFLKLSSLGLLGAAILSTRNAWADTPKQVPLDPNDPQAKALGYAAEASKVDTKKWPKRVGAEGAKQFCYSCQFYQASGDPKASKSARCTIFAGKIVNANAWCNTWTQNPKVKA